jgi:phytoene synthase
MTIARQTVRESYDLCRRVTWRAYSSFPIAFLLLSSERRRAMEALYAFLRHTDDLADDATTVTSRREALAAWRAALEQVLAAGASPTECLARSGDAGLSPILPALADTVARFAIPTDHLFAVIDGVEMDLDHSRYESFTQLEPYCQRVASAVGLACIHIWGFRGPGAVAPARDAGIALQLTNILRDIREDLGMGRLYLPLADLRECGYSVEDLCRGTTNASFFRLMRLEVERAEQFYGQGAELMDWLDSSGQRIFGLMMATYRSLLRKIAARPAAVFQRPVRLSRLQKLCLATRWSILPPRKRWLL